MDLNTNMTSECDVTLATVLPNEQHIQHTLEVFRRLLDFVHFVINKRKISEERYDQIYNGLVR